MFKDAFNKHFFSKVVQEAKSREFMDLTQGGMLVTKYASWFVQLSRFAPYLIPDEEKKAKKFERGINPRIRMMMACFDIWDFSQLVDRASIYEERLKGEFGNHRRAQEKELHFRGISSEVWESTRGWL
jgi:hypothetical protein